MNSSSSSKKHKSSSSEDQKSSSKKAKNEFIRLAVSTYMKDKRYVSTKKIRRTDFNLSQANKQFFFNKMIKNDAFINNFFLFSNVTCNSTNYKFINDQFKKFADFVELQKLEIKIQLRRFYGPIICHLYLEILKGRESSQAMDFLRNNVHHIPSDNDSIGRVKTNSENDNNTSTNFKGRYFINLVKLLFACPNLDAAENVREIIAFRSSKFEIDVNIDAIQILNEFLKNHANVMLLSTIHTWIHINVTDVKDHKSDNMIFIKEKERRQLTEMKPPLPPTKGVKKEPLDPSKGPQANVFQTALKNINHIMLEMKRIQQDYPHYVKVFDPDKFLTSGHCDRNQCHVAAGFDDSVVKLWQHSSQMLRGKNVYTSYNESICPWNVNNQFTEEEEDKEDLDKAIEEDEFPVGMNNQASSGEILLRGHSRGVTDLRFSSHYPILLTVSKDESMRCWSANNYNCSRIYNGHTNPIWCVNESPISSYVATGSKDLTARLWSLERDFPYITYIGHTQDVNCLAFHPNGSYIATGSDDFSVRLWSVATGKVFRVFSESKQPITTLAFSPDGKFLAAAGDERKIRILDLAAGQQLSELKEHSTSVTSIAWSTNGQRIASGSSDGVLKIWNIHKLEGLNLKNESSSTVSTTTSSTPTPTTFSSNNLSRICKVEYNADNVLTVIGRK
ncbi:TAF5-like RNA polymerase II p300/CBP-associated factor-associated factor 65 kDa subunit 5L [Episyrphus balteatus]|uniref:TAF5-like RNA polymerase II p300/CBP-associated factor-associated factor 65 kDa subunit 5L n=1 Tax=Episyrphus balteatus TaxID=286459 RepID=UPI0024866500|nr:TAF5-like RNA polymerase II p300/CBP-associated factor-associated factor 65 kDa subunit 5L [Episyrphus balteatus]